MALSRTVPSKVVVGSVITSSLLRGTRVQLPLSAHIVGSFCLSADDLNVYRGLPQRGPRLGVAVANILGHYHPLVATGKLGCLNCSCVFCI